AAILELVAGLLQRFDALAALFLEERSALQRLLFVDVAGQVQHVYPASAAALLGRRLTVPPGLSAGRPVFQEAPGGLALWKGVMRKGRLQGAVRGELDPGQLLRSALADVDERLTFRLEGASGMLAGEQAPVFDDELHGLDIRASTAAWTLLAAWREGVPAPDPVLRSFLWLLGGLFMLSSLTLVNRHFDYARGMALVVSSRIRALREDTRRLGRELKQGLADERTLGIPRQVFDKLPAGLFLADVRGDFIYVNERWCQITGLQVEQSLGRGWMKALEGRDKERVLSDWYGALRHGAPYTAEVRLRHPAGRTVWMLIQAEAQAGGAAGYMGVVTDITLQKQREAQHAAAEAERQGILDRLQDTYYRVDSSGRIVRLSHSLEALLGYRENELLGRHIGQLCCSRRERQGLLRLLEEEGTVRAYEMRLRHKDGRVVWVAVNAQYCQCSAGSAAVEGTACDISDRKQMEAQMTKLSRALEQAADAALISDPQGIIEYVNPAFEKMTGYRREEVIGKSTRLFKSGKQDAAFYENLWHTILSGEVFRDVFINCRKDGTLYYEQKTITPIKDDKGRITHFVSTGQDVTRRVADQQRLRFMAEHDVLTELPNRGLFMGILKKALAKASLHQRHIAVMFLDMDCFKEINDTFGHDAGDQALKIYARRLQGAVREEDVVARIGGDEFAILVDDVASVDTISRIARKIVDAVSPPIVIDGKEILLTVSIGISVFPEDGADAQTLLKNADIAMYRAKDLGHNSYQFYSLDMRAKALERLTMENSLRHALERGEFLLHYQPQLDLRSNQVFGVEALLRWQHPELGLLSPGDFVPLLEESGLIGPVGEWVLKTAFVQGRAWHEAGFSKLRISVNLSSRQFNDQEFIDKIAAIIKDSGIEPGLLELELTESIIMRNSRATNMALERLDKMGVKFSIDDFGTGYSSLSYLKRFPVDTLKIDRSFVRDVDSNPDDAAIVAAIIGMGHNMNLNVIAEGVEQSVQLEFREKK
ncbi:MAG: EAL domain-containing protein, partial [Gammaproteobacteria bacterium]